MQHLQNACAFTGHRPAKFPWKYEERDKRCVELKTVLSQQIEKMVAAGVTDFYSGMALGTDTWAARAVLELRERNPKRHSVGRVEAEYQIETAASKLHFPLRLIRPLLDCRKEYKHNL